MARQNYIFGLDIGSYTIRVIVAQTSKDRKPQIIAVVEAPSVGLRRSLVVDVEEATKSIKNALEEAERISGLSIDHTYVSLGGNHVSCRISRGVVAVSRADGEISEEDVERSIKAAQAVAIPQNREIVHIIPRFFNVDNETMIRDPVGMSGIRLEVDTIIVEASTPCIKNLTKCINQAGLEIDGLVLAPLAASRAVLTRRQKELGVLSLDIGGDTSGLTVFEEGDMIHSHILPIGSMHITNDIAIGLRTSIDVAEKIKVGYASALPEEIEKKDLIDLSKIEGEEGLVSRREVAEIVEARIEEILDLVNKELRRIDRERLLPAGVILVGGGAKIPGIVDFIKDYLALPAQIGFPQEITGIIERVDDPSYATAIGLILWGQDMEEKGEGRRFSLPRISRLGPWLTKARRWFRGLLP